MTQFLICFSALLHEILKLDYNEESEKDRKIFGIFQLYISKNFLLNFMLKIFKFLLRFVHSSLAHGAAGDFLEESHYTSTICH